MMVKNKIVAFFWLWLISGCGTISSFKSKHSIDQYIRREPLIHDILDSTQVYEPQIIYIRIDRDRDNTPHFKSFQWNVQPDQYFYPASMVKMPTALVAAEKINRISRTYPQVDLYTPLKIMAAQPPQTEMIYDSTTLNRLPNIAQLIKRIFIVSDNDAFNRLYEFVGQESLNERLRALGYHHTHIIHRLDAPQFDYEANKYTNPLTLYHEDLLQYHQDQQYNGRDIRIKGLEGLQKGVGYMREDSIINGPFDFSTKNYFALVDMAQLIKSIMFPESMTPSNRFDLTNQQWQYIRKSMSTLPRESRSPIYDSTYTDAYCKFFMYGDQHDNIPDHIRIFNKVGWAYGFLTDAAYIVDFKNNIEFILAATINTNLNGIYNDGIYEYARVGLPYLSKLGKAIYEIESRRKKKTKADLSSFKFDYSE